MVHGWRCSIVERDDRAPGGGCKGCIAGEGRGHSLVLFTAEVGAGFQKKVDTIELRKNTRWLLLIGLAVLLNA